MFVQRFIAVLFVITLSACGGGGGGGGGGSTPLSVVTVTGMTSLDGTYSTGCRQKNAIDVLEQLTISGGNWSYTRFSFSINNGLCDSVATLDSGISATLSISPGGTGAITGWTNSGIAATAPTAADLSGPLSNTESYTPLTLTATAVTGAGAYTLSMAGDTVVDFYYIVDDTGTNNILYIPDFDVVNHVSATLSGNFIKI